MKLLVAKAIPIRAISRFLMSSAFVLMMPLSAAATPFSFLFHWEGHVTSVTIPSGDPVTIQVGDYVKGVVSCNGDTGNTPLVQCSTNVYMIDLLNLSSGGLANFVSSPGSLLISDTFTAASTFFGVPPYDGSNPDPITGTLTFATPPLFPGNCLGFTTEPRCHPIQGSGNGVWTWADGSYALEADLEHFWTVPDAGSTLSLFCISLLGLSLSRRRWGVSLPRPDRGRTA